MDEIGIEIGERFGFAGGIEIGVGIGDGLGIGVGVGDEIGFDCGWDWVEIGVRIKKMGLRLRFHNHGTMKVCFTSIRSLGIRTGNNENTMHYHQKPWNPHEYQ